MVFIRLLRTKWTLQKRQIGIHIWAIDSGVTPIGQGWTNARGFRGLGGPKPDPKIIFVYFNISSVRCQPSILLYRLQLIFLWTSYVSTLIIINSSVNSKWGICQSTGRGHNKTNSAATGCTVALLMHWGEQQQRQTNEFIATVMSPIALWCQLGRVL